MTDHEIRIRTLLSVQRALLGMIYPAIRGISVWNEGLGGLIITMYLDRKPKASDREILSEIVTEVMADLDFLAVVSECVNAGKKKLTTTEKGAVWVYKRKEDKK